MGTNKMSAIKSYLMGLSDREIYKMLQLASANNSGKLTDNEKKNTTSSNVFIMPSAAEKQYAEYKRIQQFRPGSIDADQLKFIRIFETLKTLKYDRPDFYDSASDRDIYFSLVSKFEENDLPIELADLLISSIMNYIHTGYMKPMLFNGNSGCGKTTAARIIGEVMGLKSYLISVPHASSNHGLAGESKTFKCADMGAIGYSLVNCKTLNPLLIIDEIDKDCEPETHSSIKDELLSVCDASAKEFYDNFLGFSFDISRCPIILTSNTLERVSKPLADRCMVINYPDVTEERLQRILEKYCAEKLNGYMSSYVKLDKDALFDASHKLYCSGIHSIRKHQEIIDSAIGNAYVDALRKNKVMETKEEFFSMALQKTGARKSNIGF